MYQMCVYAYFFIKGKIEVKILTRKNAEEAGDQWLTEEDTKSFRELLISLLVTKLRCRRFVFVCFVLHLESKVPSAW